MPRFFINLQLFGEGGDGGDGGTATATGEGMEASATGEDIPAFIPEKARKYYKKAMEKQGKATQAPAQTVVEEEPTKPPKEEGRLSYQDLIKSDEYKDEHKAYMDKTIGDRLKKYKGIENEYSQAREILGIVAGKYGIDPTSDDFLETLKSKAEADDSFYEQYAEEHDVPTEEARRIITMERKVKQMEAMQEQSRQQAEAQQRMQAIMQAAEKTKQQFPGFDLETSMQDERFRKALYATNGDTTAAYMATNWQNVLPATVQMATTQAKQQTVNAIASGQNRPMEAGMGSVAPSVVTQDFSRMNLQQLRAYAAEQRRR